MVLAAVILAALARRVGAPYPVSWRSALTSYERNWNQCPHKSIEGQSIKTKPRLPQQPGFSLPRSAHPSKSQPPQKNAFGDDIIQSILESSVTSTYKLLSENRSSSVSGCIASKTNRNRTVRNLNSAGSLG